MPNKSALRTFAVLEFLASSPDGSTLREVSNALGVSKPTLHRYLNTLVRAGYVKQRGPRGAYYLGPKILALSSTVVEKMEIRSLSRPHLEWLKNQSQETVHVAILDGKEIVYIEKLDGPQAVLMTSRVGKRLPAHWTAVGKELLSNLSGKELKRLLGDGPLPGKTPNTLVDLKSLWTQLEKVRERGYAIDDEENEKGIRCVAAPIYDHDGVMIASVSVSGWTVTMTKAKVRKLIPIVRSVAFSISQDLGYQPSV